MPRLMPRILLFVVLSWLLVSTAVFGQELKNDDPTTASSVVTGRGPVVSLVTFGPGEMTFEKFGHTALWIRDENTTLDAIFNWGLFDFDDEAELLVNFIQGRLMYWMEPFDAPGTFNWYRSQKRTIWIQELNLTPEQARSLLRFCAWNAKLENRYYKYDYYRDNCTTRVRDALDDAVGGAIANDLKNVPTGMTYRAHTRRVIASDPILYTALMGVMGPWIDQPIDAWEETFLPFELQRHLRSVKIRLDGASVPFVTREYELATGIYPMPADKVPFYLPYFAAVGLSIGALLLAAAAWARRTRSGKVLFFMLMTGWCIFGGICGFIMLYGWLFTDHVVAYRNENVLQTDVLLIFLPLLAILGLAGVRWAPRATGFVATVIAGLSLLGLVLQILPWFKQVNGEIIALALPINIGLAIACRWRYRPATLATPVEATAKIGQKPAIGETR
jgi:hypothetical protein